MNTKKRKRRVIYRADKGKIPQAANVAAQQLTIFEVPPMTTESNSELEAVAEMPQAEAPMAAAETMEIAVPEPAPAIVRHAFDESLGLRLRAAREAKGLSCESAAQQLRLPVSVLQALEAERFERIGHAIYLRSYLSKYLHLLDLPQVLAERVLRENAEPLPPLVTTGTVSHARYLFERYSGSALYLVLTAVIVVPAVLLAMRAGFDQNLVRVAPLDTPEIGAQSKSPEVNIVQRATTEAPEHKTPTESAPPASTEHANAPLIASMTPFPPSAAAPAPAQNTAPVAGPGEHTLRLTLGEASWVEIIAGDGQKLEYGLLPAGSSRTYASAKVLDVRVGNVTGASVEIDGKTQDLTPYRHANVAHFKVADGAASTAAHSGG